MATKAEDYQKELRPERQRPKPEPQIIRTSPAEGCTPMLDPAKKTPTEEPNGDRPSNTENPIGSARERQASHGMAQYASENLEHQAPVHPATFLVQGREAKARAGVTFVSCALRSGDFHAKFLRQALPNLFWQPVMHAPGTLFGCVEHRDRRRGGHRHTQPDQSRKCESGQGC